MVKATMEIRTKALVFYQEIIRGAKEIGETTNLSEMTVRRREKAQSQDLQNRVRAKIPSRSVSRYNLFGVETTNYQAQRETSGMGGPSYQGLVCSTLLMIYRSSDSQTTWTSHSC